MLSRREPHSCGSGGGGNVTIILGIDAMPDAIRISPRLPRDWAMAEIRLVGPSGEVLILIEDPDRIGHGGTEITVDGTPVQGDTVRFPGAGMSRKAHVRIFHPAQVHRDFAE